MHTPTQIAEWYLHKDLCNIINLHDRFTSTTAAARGFGGTALTVELLRGG